jgi:hypothetical protein
MSKWLSFNRKGLILGVACGLGMLAFEGRVARAGAFELIVTENGGTPITIADNSGLDQDPTVGFINVNTTLLNPTLTSFTFSSLFGQSNATLSTVPGQLFQQGTVSLNAGAAPGTIVVDATDNDYNVPTTPPASMRSAATAIFSNATNGNTNGFTSYYNPSNTAAGNPPPPLPKEVPSGVLTYTATGQPLADSHPGPGEIGFTDTPIALVTPYGLTNETVITLSGGGGPGALATNQFSGTTQIFGSTVIPEPTSVALMLPGALVVFGVVRWRKAKA